VLNLQQHQAHDRARGKNYNYQDGNVELAQSHLNPQMSAAIA
jgi:hypothetical protein